MPIKTNVGQFISYLSSSSTMLYSLPYFENKIRGYLKSDLLHVKLSSLFMSISNLLHIEWVIIVYE